MPFPLTTLSLLLVSQLLIFTARGTGALYIVTAELTPHIQTSTLPKGYVAHPDIGSAYKIHIGEFVSWKEAENLCTLEGAHLAVIDSAKKLEYATSQPLGWGVRHVGLHKVNGEWVSVTNASIATSTVPWAQGGANDDLIFGMVGWPSTYSGLISGAAHFYGDYICEIPLTV